MPTSTLASSAARTRTSWLTRATCALVGHAVDNHVFARARSLDRHCACGAVYLREDGTHTRVRHTLSCFLGHHTYGRLIDRDGCHEYVCVQCGHPLLFRAERDPHAATSEFDKKVRYLCGLVGHRVEPAATRDGLIEYACFCGHTFLRSERGLRKVRHPMICVLFGHWIRFVTRRAGFAEYVCRHCGHPFCFADARSA
jgi:hypothetical protein